ncbi:MAG TPA: hypothetical protein VG992_03030 [Candidatus Saccharimonadales bacterium]|nr:hypothetical protein [Candidatus Saccharimonadales bacterium]
MSSGQLVYEVLPLALIVSAFVTIGYLIHSKKISPTKREWLIILLRFLIFLIVAAVGIIIAALSDISF